MKTVKIIHSADWHFDSPLSGLPPSKAIARREEIMQTFMKMIDMARESGTKLVFLAGDLFDSENISPATLAALSAAFGGAKDIRFFISPGNHDPLSARECYENMWFGENIHVFGREIESIHLPDLGVTVYGAGFPSQRVNTSILEGFKAPDNGTINIMVLHGDLARESDYNPITAEQIEKSGLHYLALGHRHNFEGIKTAGQTFFAYSGAPEGRGFDETGEKGIIMGEVGRDNSALKFLPIAKRKCEIIEVSAQGALTHAEILERIRASVNTENITKVVLTGALAEGAELSIPYLERVLARDVFFAKIIDETRPAGEEALAALAKGDAAALGAGIKGAFAAKLLKKAEADPIAAAALRYGLLALEGRSVIPHDE